MPDSPGPADRPGDGRGREFFLVSSWMLAVWAGLIPSVLEVFVSVLSHVAPHSDASFLLPVLSRTQNAHLLVYCTHNMQGQIYEREEIEKYLEEKGNAAISPVTRKRFKNKGLFPSVHVRNTIEHLVESGIIEGDLAKTWKKRMREKKRNEKKVKNLEKRAKEGDANAMYSFALGYALGKYGLKRDGAEAFKWAKKSADMQNVHGMAFAGHCLVGGLGDEIDKNEREGLVLISLAAAQGSVCACILLGEMYYHGQYGVAKNSNNAKHWLEKALAGEDSERHIGRSALNDARDMLKEIDARGGADDVARGFESYEAEEYLSN